MRTPDKSVYNAIHSLREKDWAFSILLEYLKKEYEYNLIHLIDVKDEFDFKHLQGIVGCLRDIISILEERNESGKL